MDRQILEELVMTGAGFTAGLRLMAVYDMLRILRIFVPHCSAAVGAEDLIYWLYSSVSVFRLIYRGSGGTVRMYMIAAVGAGMILWDRILSRRVMGVLQKARKWIKMKNKKRKKAGE